MPSLEYQVDNDDEYPASELLTLQQRLRDFGKKIVGTRVALTAHSAQKQLLDQEWQEMLRIHAEKRSELESAGSLTREVVEGFSLDLDALRHTLQWWIFYNDTKS